MKIRVFKLIQRGGRGTYSDIYVGVIPARDFAERARIDRWSPENRHGYQRTLSEARVRDTPGGIVRYLMKELGCLPSGLIVNVRGGVRYAEGERKGVYSEGVLDVGEEPLWIVDGQHRLEGLRRAMQRNADFEMYPVVVSILAKPERFDELMLFYVVNRRQSGVDTELAYRHIQRILWERGGGWLRELEGARGYRLAKALDVVDHLNASGASPLAGRIRLPGERVAPEHLVTDKVLVNALVEAIRKGGTESGADLDFAEDYLRFWARLRDVYPEVFDGSGWLIWRAAPLRALTRLFTEIKARDPEFSSLWRLREATGGDHGEPLEASFWRDRDAAPWPGSPSQVEAYILAAGRAKLLAGINLHGVALPDPLQGL